MNIKDLIITSLETITAFDVTTGDYKFTLDELQDASISQTQDNAEVTGKGGRKLATLKRNKAVTISGTNGLVSAGLLEAQTGGSFTSKATEVLWVDYLTITDASNDGTGLMATTNYTAIGTAGAEIVKLFVNNADGNESKVFEQGTAASAGKFAYAPATRMLTFNKEDVSAGTEIVVYYKRNITASVLDNNSDDYSATLTLYVDALAEDKCSNVYRVQFFIPKADFSGEFSIDMGDDQTVHAFEAEALAGACGAGGKLWSYTVYGANAADIDA